MDALARSGKNIAVIDCGTNTFHLLIMHVNGLERSVIHKEKIPVKIGEGGLTNDTITSVALKRAKSAFIHFKEVIQSFNVQTVKATATSAFRNAHNAQEVIKSLYDVSGINIQVIAGELEAQIIFEGVRLAVNLSTTPALIMDIGGGSVEFIICTNSGVLWKQSFEIGGQRLMDKFHNVDPIPTASIDGMNKYLKNLLTPLKLACQQFKPKTLIGASGTFDSLVEIYHKQNGILFSLENATQYKLPLYYYHKINEEIISKNRPERLEIPGMVEMRVNMIVVACLLIEFSVREFEIQEIVTSTFALKEGLIERIIDGIPIQ